MHPQKFQPSLSILILVGILSASLHFVTAAQNTKPSDTRTYQAPDLGYTFDYLLDHYSVRPGFIPSGAEILFPGVITIDPNDSLIYRDGKGLVFKVSIAAVFAPDGASLDKSLFGTGPLIQYESDLLESKVIQDIKFGSVAALRVDDVPVGPTGSITDIIALHEGLLYELLIEPVGEERGGVFGRNLINNILKTFQFADNA